MPERTNLLQQVVGILHEHAAPGAEVKEPAMLMHRITGEEREVDVVIATQVAGYEILVSVEARERGRKADSPWVESMLAKHQDLPTSKLILVSESGFYKPARELALAKGALPLAPEDLDPADSALAVLRGLPALWPKQVALTPLGATLEVLTPDGGQIRIADAVPAEVLIFSEAGAAIGTVADYFGTVFDQRFPELAAMIGLADIEEDIDRFFTFGSSLPPVPTPDLPAMFLRREPDGQFQRLVESASPAPPRSASARSPSSGAASARSATPTARVKLTPTVFCWSPRRARPARRHRCASPTAPRCRFSSSSQTPRVIEPGKVDRPAAR